ncbi:RNA polymerase sigma factor [Actinacidiphila reveromycinica]|uniref:RNA polymerase sigma factor n=1 Tax=Actinacidiphila reveromycinica TaxID=659352 RepID=UPI001F466B00|nr:RNA polymerase sigma factor [Streptomyces sp. SN-593]
MSAAQGGDETAFRVLYRAVQPQLLRYVRSLVGPGDAEDVASEAWLQIARDLPSFRGGGTGIKGWAARIARNRALDHIRARSRRPVAGAGVEELVALPGRADTAGEALESVATDRALAAIAALPREQAEAVLLRVVMGLDSTSAAQVLGRRAGSVRMATHRGLRRLAEQLAAEQVPAGRLAGEQQTAQPAHPAHPARPERPVPRLSGEPVSGDRGEREDGGRAAADGEADGGPAVRAGTTYSAPQAYRLDVRG